MATPKDRDKKTPPSPPPRPRSRTEGGASPPPRVVARSAASGPATPPVKLSAARKPVVAPKALAKAAAPKPAVKAPAAKAPAAKAASVKTAPVKATPVKAAPVKASSVKTAPVKTAPVKATPVKAAPVRPAAARAVAAAAPPAKAAPRRRPAKPAAARGAPSAARELEDRTTAAKAAAAEAAAVARAAAARPAARAAAAPAPPRARRGRGAKVAPPEPVEAAADTPLFLGEELAAAVEGVPAETPLFGAQTVEEAPAFAAARPRRRSLRGIVAACLVTLVVAIVLTFAFTAPLPSIGGLTLFGLGRGAPALPSSGGLTTLLIIAALSAAVLAIGISIATSEKRGWRWILDTRVVALAAALVLIGFGLTQLFPPGAQFDVSEIPGLAGNALQGTLAQPENGYPRIKITRVSIDLLLVQGDGKTPPVKYEAFTYPNADHLLAAGNDGGGNSYVYAHARTGMFWRLHDLHIGDLVEVDYGNGKVLKYRVAELHPQVNWKDFSWLQPTTDDRLTLQTCNGWKDDDPRFIVVARRVTDQTASAAGQ